MISVSRLINIIKRFTGKRILVLGDLMVDHYVFGEAKRLSPEAPVPVVDVTSEAFKPGGAANVINNILSLGGEVSTVGVVGVDEKGSWLIDHIKSKGGGVGGIIKDKNRPTTTKMRILVGHHQLIRADYESREEVGINYTEKILEYIRGTVDEVECIVVSDYDKGIITTNLIKGLVKIKKEKRKTIIVDPKIRHFRDYKGVSIIKSNINNASQVLGITLKDEVNIQKMAIKLLDQFECEAIIITLGKEGMSLLEKNGNYVHIPSLARAVYDITGAGDTVTATLAISLSTDASIVEATTISNVAAGIKVGKIGTAVVTRDEIVEQLNSLDPSLYNL